MYITVGKIQKEMNELKEQNIIINEVNKKFTTEIQQLKVKLMI